MNLSGPRLLSVEVIVVEIWINHYSIVVSLQRGGFDSTTVSQTRYSYSVMHVVREIAYPYGRPD